MAKKKYYAVRKGKKPGIYETWEETKEHVLNFYGAEYKSFKDLEQAKNFMLNIEQDNDLYYEQLTDDLLLEGYTVIYTDGSYEESINKSSWAAVILTGKKEKHLSGIINNPELMKSRNIVGEVFAVIKGLEYCKKKNIKKVAIFHDYEGLKYWATREWRAREGISKLYIERLNEFDDIKTEYYWVKGHSKIKYNELADKLAYDALMKE